MTIFNAGSVERFQMNARLFLSVAFAVVAACAAWGGPALIHYRADAEPDRFVKGVLLFSDRVYKLAEVPKAFEGKPFLRGSIMGLRYVVAQDGELTVVTPQRVPKSASASTRARRSCTRSGLRGRAAKAAATSPAARPDTRPCATVGISNDIRSDVW